MKFKRIWCFGNENGRYSEDDFVIAYVAENGTRIDVEFVFGNNSLRSYRVNGKAYTHLKDAKAAC